jgi:hypothetical protein
MHSKRSRLIEASLRRGQATVTVAPDWLRPLLGERKNVAGRPATMTVAANATPIQATDCFAATSDG